MLYAWQAQNTGGDTKKKCTSAMVFVGMCAGNVIGPLLYSTNDAPLYRAGLIADLVMFVTVGVISGYVAHSELILAISASRQTGLTNIYRLTPFYLAYLNKKHEKRRSELGKSAHVIDLSMIRKDQLVESKAVEIEDVRDQKTSVESDKGLLDVTDLMNEDFIYVY